MDEQKTTAFPVTLFYAYARIDERLRQKLENHLSALSLQGFITTWHNRQIVPGTNWKHALDDRINAASVILLLISPDFLASDYCSSVEMQQTIARHEEGNTHVIPILLRPTDWEHLPFSSLQVLPRNGKPVTTWRNQDDAFLDIVQGIRRVIETFNLPSSMTHTSSHHTLITSSSRRDQHWEASQREARRKYLKRMEERYTFMTFAQGPIEGFSLRAVFQPLALRRDPVPAEDCQREERRPLLGEPVPSENEVRVLAENGEEALAKSPQNRIIVLGGPGTGKTTLLQSLISERIQQALLDLTAPVPILLSLPDLARSSKPLPEYLTYLMKEAGISESPPDLLWRAIEEGRAFVCLDSLDEVTPGERVKVIRLINELAARSGNTWVVGSRFTDYKGGQFKRGQFAEWEVLPLDHEMREQLALRLLPALHWLLPEAETSVAPGASLFVQHLEHHQHAAAWGENPLLFSLAATVFVRTGTLPMSLAALYKQVIDAVVQVREPDSARQKVLLRTIAGLALELYQIKGRTFNRDDIVTHLSRVRQSQYENWSTDEMVNRIIASGLLDVVAQETYGFRHQTFQEYLAAVELAQQLVSKDRERREQGWSFAWKKRTYSRWTEILRLMVGVLVQNYRREGALQALRWLRELGKQRESDDGDIGNLGLTLALRSLPEISTRSINFLQELRGEEVEETIIISWITALREGISHERFPHSQRQRTLLDLSNEIRRLGHPLASMAVEKLVACLGEKDERVRLIALKALVPLQEHTPVEPILALLNDPDPYVLHDAVDLLGAMKERAPIDHLLNLLNHEDWYVRGSVENALVVCEEHVSVASLQEALVSENWWTRTSAAKVLAQRGEHVPVALFLADLSASDWERRRGVIEFFGLLGNDTPIELLLSTLGDESWFVRSSASKALGKLGGRVPVEAVLQALHSVNKGMRYAAADALADLTKHVTVPIAPLVAALDDAYSGVRRNIVLALGHIRVGVPVEPLLKALHDEDDSVRWFAASALVTIGAYPSEEQIVKEIASHLVWMRLTAWQVISLASQHVQAELLQPAIIHALNDTEDIIRLEAVKVCAQLGECTSLEPVVQALRSHDSRVRTSAAEALGKIEKCASREPPLAATNVLGEGGTYTSGDLLLDVLRDPDPSVRSMAVWALGQHTGRVPIEALLETLNDEQYMVRRQVVNVLGALGYDAPIEQLLKMVHTGNESVRPDIVRVLRKLAAYVPIEPLLTLVHHEDLQVRVAAFQVIGCLQQPVLSDLFVSAMYHEEGAVRVAAIRAAGKRGMRELLPNMLSFLEDKEQSIREAAIEALEPFTEEVPIEFLQQALKSPWQEVRAAAIRTVGKRDMQELLPNILSFLEDKEQSIREAAIEALEPFTEEVPIEFLQQALKSPWQEVRIWAATMLPSMGEENTAKQVLLLMLDEHDEHGELAIVQTLGKLKVQAAIEPLCTILSKGHRYGSQSAAIKALREIGGPAAAKALLDFLWGNENAGHLRVEVIEALGKMKEGLVTEALRLALGDSEQEVRNAVVVFFQQRSSEALYDLIPEAITIAQGGASGTVLGSMAQGVIADTIGRLSCTSPLLLDQLTELLDWPYWQVRMKAAQALERLRRNIPDVAIRRLHHLLHDPQSRAVRYAAHDALTAILSLETGIEDDETSSEK